MDSLSSIRAGAGVTVKDTFVIVFFSDGHKIQIKQHKTLFGVSSQQAHNVVLTLILGGDVKTNFQR